ncbi:MAG: hypothetical protein EOP04_08765 [Proteobacteria bacterium]|nr:MAG: hypothetical protein EOP04_08765 [Pseudomonadota bacterium]
MKPPDHGAEYATVTLLSHRSSFRGPFHTSPADGYEGLLNFENWTNDFWEKVEDEKKFNPNTFQQKNNCDSMDPL